MKQMLMYTRVGCNCTCKALYEASLVSEGKKTAPPKTQNKTFIHPLQKEQIVGLSKYFQNVPDFRVL